jgi:large conductance mechanosensitive channel
MLKEFKTFAMRGNVIDMGVGIIIGGAFGKIVSSFVNDVLMPPIGLLLGGVDFSNLFLSLGRGEFPSVAAAEKAGAPILKYGVFLNTVIDFLIVAFAIFLLVRAINRLQGPAPAAAPITKECPRCASAIPIKASRCPLCTSELAAA